ncbi:MAG: hypothetical protein IT256_05620 [Chitinophagaceae bacterium]|nr:hypothetical protein [Chitinophagaceae bacterium]
MKKITTVILLLCLSCQLVLKLSIITWFEINQEYIAATLCENKDKPELTCCGKCVLTKQLKKADNLEQNEKKNEPTKAEKTATVQFVIPNNIATARQVIFPQESPTFAPFSQYLLQGYRQDIFHPPSVIYS